MFLDIGDSAPEIDCVFLLKGYLLYIRGENRGKQIHPNGRLATVDAVHKGLTRWRTNAQLSPFWESTASSLSTQKFSSMSPLESSNPKLIQMQVFPNYIESKKRLFHWLVLMKFFCRLILYLNGDIQVVKRETVIIAYDNLKKNVHFDPSQVTKFSVLKTTKYL